MSRTWKRRNHGYQTRPPALPKRRRPKCGATGKICFPTHELALARIAEILTETLSTVNTFRAYHCSFCSHYHLTTKPAH